MSIVSDTPADESGINIAKVRAMIKKYRETHKCEYLSKAERDIEKWLLIALDDVVYYKTRYREELQERQITAAKLTRLMTIAEAAHRCREAQREYQSAQIGGRGSPSLVSHSDVVSANDELDEALQEAGYGEEKDGNTTKSNT